MANGNNTMELPNIAGCKPDLTEFDVMIGETGRILDGGYIGSISRWWVEVDTELAALKILEDCYRLPETALERTATGWRVIGDRGW